MNPAEDGPKRAVRGRLVKVLVHRRVDRGMVLEPYAARCVRRGEVHELVTTDQVPPVDAGTEEAGAAAGVAAGVAGAGRRIDRVGFVGFVEFECGGVLDRGDMVRVGGRLLGIVLGFDACHLPNHYNILIGSAEPVTGAAAGLAPEAQVVFEQGPAGPDRTRRDR